MNGNAMNFVKRGYFALDEQDFVAAESFFEEALNVDAEFSDAYMGKLLCDMLCQSEKELIALGVPVSDNINFKRAKRFSQAPEKFDDIENKIRECAREKADICHSDNRDDIALKWLERIGEQDSEYGIYYKMSEITEGFTLLDVAAVAKYAELSDRFLNVVRSEELKQRFIADNDRYMKLAQEAQEKLQREEEEKQRRLEEEKRIAEENKRRKEEQEAARKKKQEEEAAKKKQEEERLAAEAKRKHEIEEKKKAKKRKTVALVTAPIILLLCAFFSYMSLTSSIYYMIAVWATICVGHIVLASCKIKKAMMLLVCVCEVAVSALGIILSGGATLFSYESAATGALLGTALTALLPAAIATIVYLLGWKAFIPPIVVVVLSIGILPEFLPPADWYMSAGKAYNNGEYFLAIEYFQLAGEDFSDTKERLEECYEYFETNCVDMTALPMEEAKVGYGSLSLNKDLEGDVLNTYGFAEHEYIVYKTGILAHAYSSVTFDVSEYSDMRFACVGGIDIPKQTRGGFVQGSVKFIVLADGVEIYKSELVRATDKSVLIDVDIPEGTQKLTLIADSDGSNTADHSLWASPYLMPQGK